jgi:hypothetical protein
MDAVRQCLPLTSAPELARILTVIKLICSSVEQAQISKLQLGALAHSVAQLLQTLDGEYRAKRLQKDITLVLADLSTFVTLLYYGNLNLIPDSADYWTTFQVSWRERHRVRF